MRVVSRFISSGSKRTSDVGGKTNWSVSTQWQVTDLVAFDVESANCHREIESRNDAYSDYWNAADECGRVAMGYFTATSPPLTRMKEVSTTHELHLQTSHHRRPELDRDRTALAVRARTFQTPRSSARRYRDRERKRAVLFSTDDVFDSERGVFARGISDSVF